MAFFSGSFTQFQPLAHHWHTQDHTTDDFDVTNRICKIQPFDTILKDYATTRQLNVEFGGYGLLGTLATVQVSLVKANVGPPLIHLSMPGCREWQGCDH